MISEGGLDRKDQSEVIPQMMLHRMYMGSGRNGMTGLVSDPGLHRGGRMDGPSLESHAMGQFHRN